MKNALFIFACFAVASLQAKADDPKKPAQIPKRDLSSDSRIQVLTSWANWYEIKGVPEKIFAGNKSLKTAMIKVQMPTPNGQFYTTMTFERGKKAPEPFFFVISDRDAGLITIQFSEILFSGGDNIVMNLGELLAAPRPD